jgi:hypothetical protein
MHNWIENILFNALRQNRTKETSLNVHLFLRFRRTKDERSRRYFLSTILTQSGKE